MNFLLRLAGSYVDAVLNTFYPLEQERSMADMERDEVSTGGRVGPDDLWPETPDPIDHMIALLEDIRNLLQSSVAREEQSAAESPGEAVPPVSPGHPDDPMFWGSDLFGAAQTLLCMADGARRKPKDHDERLRAIAQRLAEIANAFKPYVTK